MRPHLLLIERLFEMNSTVVIIGGGITGLSAAYFLKQERTFTGRIILLEKERALGGKIRTEFHDSFLVETGPESFVRYKPASIDLCNALGLRDELIKPKIENSKTLMLRGGTFHALPDGVLSFSGSGFEILKSPESTKDLSPRHSPFVSLRDGLGSLINRLRERLPQVEIRTGANVIDIQFAPNGYCIAIENEAPIEADVVIVASESHSSGKFLRNVDSMLADLLHVIPYASSSVVTFAFQDRSRLSSEHSSFGFLLSPEEGMHFTACTLTSEKWENRAPDGILLVRLYVPGSFSDCNQLISEIRPILKIRGEQMLTVVHSHPNALPQYVAGHSERLDEISNRLTAHPGIFLAGAAYRGVGISDCIESGKKAVQDVIRYLNHS